MDVGGGWIITFIFSVLGALPQVIFEVTVIAVGTAFVGPFSPVVDRRTCSRCRLCPAGLWG